MHLVKQAGAVGIIILGLLTACATVEGAVQSTSRESDDPAAAEIPVEESPPLPNLGPAPELENEIWLNTDHPLRLAELRGKVVLLDMWTFG